MRSFLFPSLMVLVACSGKAVVDDGGSGAGGTTSSSSSTRSAGTTGPATNSSSSGALDCESLGAALVAALDEAMRCDSCTDGPDPCEYLSGQQLTDSCGCPVPVNSTNPEAVTAALEIYQAWTGAGCGPLECGQPCAVSSDPRCTSIGGGCDGVCAAL